MAVALQPLAKEEAHPDAFYRGLRLVAIDGTQFSIANTPQVLGTLTKAATRRFQAAFAKVGVCVLVELGLHNPLAVAVGLKQETELPLAKELFEKLPQKSLLLADRLYGAGKTLSEIGGFCQAANSHFLVRVRGVPRMRVLKKERDGSALVEVKLRDPKSHSRFIGTIVVREIRGRVRKAGRAWSEVRLWTSLEDAALYPSEELFGLYAQRWEHELYYKELKVDLRSSELLQSHTVETAAQEIAALILASAVVARERSTVAAEAQAKVRGVSFLKTRDFLESLWFVLKAGEEILSTKQERALIERAFALISQEAILPKRRSRSCPRAVRQPVSGWPRLVHNSSIEGDLTLEILPVD